MENLLVHNLDLRVQVQQNTDLQKPYLKMYKDYTVNKNKLSQIKLSFKLYAIGVHITNTFNFVHFLI